jgi:DNA polymerase gamma 1
MPEPTYGMRSIKTISPELHRRLFATPQPLIPDSVVEIVDRELDSFGLSDLTDDTEDGELPLPVWATSAKDMFQKAANAYLEPYRPLLQRFNAVTSQALSGKLTKPASEFWYGNFQPGWNIVTPRKGVIPTDVPPSNSAYILDFETLPLNGKEKAWLPLCCIALRCLDNGSYIVYVWVTDFAKTTTRTPFGTGNVITGWNVPGYDRMYLESEWSLESSGNVFPDLMSFHIITRGASNQQVPILKIHEKDSNVFMPSWVDETSSNGLADVYHYHFGRRLDKGVRDELIQDTTGDWARSHMGQVLEYCFYDNFSCAELWGKIYPEYLSMNTQDTQLAGSLIGSTSIVPLDPDRWDDYYPNAEGMYQDTITQINEELTARADELAANNRDWFEHETELITALKAYQRSLQPPKPSNPKKPLSEAAVAKKAKQREKTQRDRLEVLKELLGHYYTNGDEVTASVEQCLSSNRSRLDPWERELNWSHDASNWYHIVRKEGLTLGKRIVPLLLKISYNGNPVRYSDGKGWHTDKELVPHPEGGDKVATTLFSKDMRELFNEQLLTTNHPTLKPLLAKVESTVIWVSMRKRVNLMKVENVEFEGNTLPLYVPQTVPHKTISGRRGDKDIHVFAHAKGANPAKGKLGSIGSGFLSLIRAPKGWKILKFDFDSQELRLSSDVGCLELGYIGSTPLAMVVEIGSKDKGTDFHSVNSKTTGITNRTLIKNFGYAIIYGAGFQTLLLTAMKGGISEEIAREYVQKFMASFVGVKVDGRPIGGIASAMFRVLKRLGAEFPLRALFGGMQLSRSISGQKDYATTRNNAVIQSTGSVMLNHVLTLIPYLAAKFNVPCRFLLSRHDEVAYMVKDGYELQFAYIMQLAHCYCWAKYIKEMGLNTLPLNRAYASSIEVLEYYLKEPNADSATPDMPYNVSKGYSIKKGEILDAIAAGAIQY